MTLLVVSFIAGVLTILAPCILPLIPVIVGGAISEGGNRRRPFIIITALSLSVFVFTLILKGSTALITVSPSFWTYVSAIILIAFGLTLLFPETWAKLVLRIPGHNRPDAWLNKGYKNKGTFWADVLVGAALGPVFTTCSPTFFVILATVLPQSLGMGIIDLLAYIVGLAISLLIVALIGQKIIDKLEWAVNPYGWFKKTLGVIFILVAVLIAFGADKKIEAAILNGGFFDVTTLEQNIHLSLEGPNRLNNNSNNQNPVQLAPTDSTTNSPTKPTLIGGTKNATSKNVSNLPPPPREQNEGRFVEIKDPAGFVNSAPFKLADLVGKKVILIDFIDYSCINCERTFPFLNDWYSKYKDQGLEIVAIHTPEFSFEKDIANVTAAAKQYGLKFPIVLDNNYATWNAYRNEYWPHKYLINIKGDVVYDKIGEGDDDLIESEIVKLLNDRKVALGESGTINTGNAAMPDYTVQTQSPETYFGAMRNESFGNGAPFVTGAKTYTIPKTLSPNEYYLGGDWNIVKEYAQNQSANAQLSFEFSAANLYFVAESGDGSTIEATVLIDGLPIKAENYGADVKNGMLQISGSRLFHVFKSTSMGAHRIDLIFTKPGVKAYTFTFG